MKHLILTTIAAVLVVGCATTQQPEPTTAKAPVISIIGTIRKDNIEAVKQHLAAGMDVNAKDDDNYGATRSHQAAHGGHKETVELLIAAGADVNAKTNDGWTPLDRADDKETADLLRKHGGKTGKELK